MDDAKRIALLEVDLEQYAPEALEQVRRDLIDSKIRGQLEHLCTLELAAIDAGLLSMARDVDCGYVIARPCLGGPVFELSFLDSGAWRSLGCYPSLEEALVRSDALLAEAPGRRTLIHEELGPGLVHLQIYDSLRMHRVLELSGTAEIVALEEFAATTISPTSLSRPSGIAQRTESSFDLD